MSMIPIKKKNEKEKRTYVCYWSDPERYMTYVTSVDVEAPIEWTEHQWVSEVIKFALLSKPCARPAHGDFRVVRLENMTHYEYTHEVTTKIEVREVI